MKKIMIGITLILGLLLSGCSTSTKKVEAPMIEVSSKNLFSSNQENWLPINKNQDFQNEKNNKVVK